MKAVYRVGLVVVILVLVSAVAVGCGGDDPGGGGTATTQSEATMQDQTTQRSETTAVDSGQGEAQVETEVTGMPADFPSDIPVHPGTVTAYEKIDVTESMTVYQLTVNTRASLDDVMEWYQTQLPAGWSVGFSEKDGDEAKIALNGGDYAPADPDGGGGGVIVGVFAGDTTEIVTTATVMAR
jgi:hypothetical protein